MKKRIVNQHKNKLVNVNEIPVEQLNAMVNHKDHIEFKQQYPDEYFDQLKNFLFKSSEHMYNMQYREGLIKWKKHSVDKSCNSIASKLLQCYEIFKTMDNTDFQYYDSGSNVLRFKIQQWFYFAEINFARMGKYYC